MKKSIKTLLACSMITFGIAALPALAVEQPKANATEQAALTRISINSADAATLAEHLVGIGPSKAEAIVEWRNAHGRFTSIEQLLEIKGIGEGTLNKNKARVTL